MEPAANAVAAAPAPVHGHGGATLAWGHGGATLAWGHGGAALAYGDCVAFLCTAALRLPGATLSPSFARRRCACLRRLCRLPSHGGAALSWGLASQRPSRMWRSRANALHANTRQPADGRKALSGCIHDTLWPSRDVRRHGPRPPAALPKPLTVMDIRTFQRADRFRLPGRRPPSVPCPQPGAPALSEGDRRPYAKLQSQARPDRMRANKPKTTIANPPHDDVAPTEPCSRKHPSSLNR